MLVSISSLLEALKVFQLVAGLKRLLVLQAFMYILDTPDSAPVRLESITEVVFRDGDGDLPNLVGEAGVRRTSHGQVGDFLDMGLSRRSDSEVGVSWDDLCVRSHCID